MQIGLLVTATSNAKAFGVSTGATASEQDVDDALIKGLNAQGGLAGRKITPIYAKTDTGSSNPENDFAAACARFTQDNHVEAVLGYNFTYYNSFESCLAKRGVPHLSTGFNVADPVELAKVPLLRALDVPTIDRRGLLKIDNGFADKVLTTSSKLGIITDNCPGTARSLNKVVLPQLKARRLSEPRVVTISCTTDAAAASSALSNAVLQFRSSNVDQVVFHSVSEGPPLLLFATSAESQGYRPGYLMTSLGNLDLLSGLLPASQLKNVNAYGWLPTQDVPPSRYGPRNASQKRCLALLKTGGVAPTAGQDYYYAYNVCEAFFLYERALAGTGGSTSGRAVVDAVSSLGTGFESLTNDGGSLFSRDRPDAPRAARRATFSTDCRCFSYSGAARPIPTV